MVANLGVILVSIQF